jgi:hypothetical protein
MRSESNDSITTTTCLGKHAAETLRSPAVQVIGITSVPHTIVLDSSNRVLVNNDAFLNDDRIEEMVEEYFQSR